MTKVKKTVPREALLLRSAPKAELVKTDGESSRKFKMNAHTGQILDHWYWGKLAVDLSGLKVLDKRTPVLRDHFTRDIAGLTTWIKKTDDGLMVEGELSAATESGKEIAALAAEGFPWQASIFAKPLVIERVEEGASIEVNGQTLNGPGAVFRKSELREISFTVFGVDSDTWATPMAEGQSEEIELEFEELTTEAEATMSKTPTQNPPEVKFANVEELEAACPELVEKIREAAKLAAVEPAPDSAAALTEKFPALVAEIVKAAALAERERAGKIRECAYDGQDELVEQLIADGSDAEAALAKLKDARLETLETTGPTSPGNNPEGLSQATDFDGWKQEWGRQTQLHAEFPTAESYAHFKQGEAEGRF